jgi:pimeloyl-ACP methyl ester carboxylesterase
VYVRALRAPTWNIVRIRIFAAAAALALPAAFAYSAPGGRPGLTDSHPCQADPSYTCSTLTVPLDHSGRRPGSLRLSVAVAANSDAPRGVLLVLAGGPGQAGLPLLGRLGSTFARERSAYRLVVYDQRGTGAGALRCGLLQTVMGASDLYPPPAAAVRDCARRLGSRRAFYGTDDVVADMESLRDALGISRWAVDGISYGTFVGERYALAHPTHVSKLVLDSVVPHDGRFDLGVVEIRATGRVLRDACGASCVDDLAIVVRTRHDGPLLLDALTLDSIIDPTFRQVVDVPAALRSARRGDVTPLARFLARMHDYEMAPPEDLDQGLHASALCADWRYPWGSSAAPLAGREASLARAVARLSPTELSPFDRATAAGNGFVRQCLPWAPAPPTPEPPAGAKLHVPALLVNGDHDLSTPLEWARQELRSMPRGRLVVVPGAGHSVQFRAQSSAGRDAVAAFLLGR